MNRTEFCEMMAQAKKKSGVTTSELSFTLRMLVSTLRRFEKGTHNFSVQKLMEYLNVLNANLCIEKNDKQLIVLGYSQLINACIEARSKQYSQRALAELLGCSQKNIATIEKEKSALSIDTFLKLMDVLGYTI